MRKGEYLRDHRIHILTGLLVFAVTEITLLLFHTYIPLQIFICFIEICGMAGMLLYDYARKRSFYREMEKRLEVMDEKYLLPELMKRPEFLEGRLWWNALEQMEQSMNDEIFAQVRKNNEFKRYIETWIHEVKLPIASIRLMLHQDYGGQTRAVKEQTERIERYVEQVLYYLRSEVPERDYVIRKYSLKSMSDQVLSENRDSLILNRIVIRQETADIPVLTDEKWLRFMIGQIISNAVKYRKADAKEKSVIRLWSEEREEGTVFHVWDNGIGIPGEDLPRIFEKSFTGRNGRVLYASTGMGLYLCRKLAEQLGHRISAQSREGEYTDIRITFGKNRYMEYE